MIHLAETQYCKANMRACMLSYFSCIQLFATLWTVALQAAQSMGILQAITLERLPLPPSGYLPHPGIEPVSLMSLGLTGRFFTIHTTNLN